MRVGAVSSPRPSSLSASARHLCAAAFAPTPVNVRRIFWPFSPFFFFGITTCAWTDGVQSHLLPDTLAQRRE